MRSTSARTEPLWQRLPAILAYPAASSMLWMIGGLCLLRLLSHLPNLLGLLFEAVFWVMGFKLAVEALLNTAHGRLEPFGGNDLMATDGQAMHQLLLAMVVFAPMFAVLAWVGVVPALVMLALAVLFLPAAIILVAINGYLPGALNPLAWGDLIGRIGGAYFAVAAVLAGLVIVSLVAQAIFFALLPNDMGSLPAGFVSVYVLVAGYHLLGCLIHDNKEVLGLDVAPAIPRATFANPLEDEAVASAEALAADGRHAAAADLLERMFFGRGASDPLHDRYRQCVIAAGDTPRLVRHSREYISRLLETGKDKRALAVATETLAHDADFQPALAEDVARLVAQAVNTGQAQLAVALARDFETRFPGSDRCPEVVLAAATLMADRLGQEEAARNRLRACASAFPGHPLAPSLREAQASAQRLLDITARTGAQP
ncbi:MAG: hypothetical protein K0M70_13350 [Arenimonas sp.]|uniref:tetratricopeptide repeat protein n=1 Tax=Arenimonas sp. TaxID=1872635 RepID=UPI0025C6A3F0|nr:hypothetical protein [Arenimonas sp.]MBW8368831.1 hypothetical protein [Arenimonas sp.]